MWASILLWVDISTKFSTNLRLWMGSMTTQLFPHGTTRKSTGTGHLWSLRKPTLPTQTKDWEWQDSLTMKRKGLPLSSTGRWRGINFAKSSCDAFEKTSLTGKTPPLWSNLWTSTASCTISISRVYRQTFNALCLGLSKRCAMLVWFHTRVELRRRTKFRLARTFRTWKKSTEKRSILLRAACSWNTVCRMICVISVYARRQP